MDFVITKVNGRDVREHADALRAFENAPEPIVVEVRRSQNGVLVSTAVQTDKQDAAGCEVDEDDEDELEFILDDAFDYEVVTLNKSQGEGVGVSLCYSSPAEDDDEVECFVSDVSKGGVAARDGRIRQGDQILQLNGESLTERVQAERLLAQADQDTTVTLLLSRLTAQELTGDLDECDLVSTSFIVKSGGEEDEEDKNSCELNNRSDKKETSSEEERERSQLAEERLRVIDHQLYVLSKKMAVITLDSALPAAAEPRPQLLQELRPFGDSETEHIYETIPEDNEPIYSLPYEPPKHEIWVDVEPPQKRDSGGSSDKEKDSSSAYNTGESCRSTQLTLDLKQQTAQPLSQQKQEAYSAISCENCRQCIRLPPLGSPSKKNKQHHQQQTQQPPPPPQQEVPNTMYTNAANLQRTIWLQQEMFRQALERKKSPKSPSSSKAQTPSSPVYHPPNLSSYQFVSGYGVVKSGPELHRSATRQRHKEAMKQEEPMMVWKVKKKADGTRYITRRPVRNKILQERASKITEERVGLTTDDDAMSELKLGRYWNKEERKKHLERSRERRKQHETLAREHDSRNKVVQSSGSSSRRPARVCPPTASLSNRGGGKMAPGILSVTTV